MSDLSEQLRYASYSLPSNGPWIERDGESFPNNVCSQAADEMDRCDTQKAALVMEVERLTADLAKAELHRDTYRDAWQTVAAEIAELRAQEPVGKIVFDTKYLGDTLVSKTRPQLFVLDGVDYYRFEPDTLLYAGPVPAAQAVPDDGLRGFSVWLNREDWGHVVDGLILERERSEQRKSNNPESNSNYTAGRCVELIKQLHTASEKAILSAPQPPADHIEKPLGMVEQKTRLIGICQNCGHEHDMGQEDAP